MSEPSEVESTLRGMTGSESLFDRVVFIIGAGHSINAKAPSTEELTSWIIDGTGPLCLSRWSRERIDLLKSVREHLETSGFKPTYESIFTWLWTSYFSSDPTMYRTAWDAADPFQKIGMVRSTCNEKVAYDTLRLIEEGVQQALNKERLEPSEAPKLTLDAVDNSSVGHSTLITLNHDRVLEQLFEASDDYCDGFKQEDEGTGAWSASQPEARQWEKRIQLIKMHGSIDWWSPRPWNDGGVVYRSPTYPGRGCARLPLLLVGTGPKLFQASNLKFARQILDAGHALSRATCVIVVGYGFGDVRMNSLWHGAIRQALDEKRRLPTLVVNPNPDGILDYVRKTKLPTDLLSLLENTNKDLAGKKTVEYLKRNAEKVEWSECAAEIEKLTF